MTRTEKKMMWRWLRKRNLSKKFAVALYNNESENFTESLDEVAVTRVFGLTFAWGATGEFDLWNKIDNAWNDYVNNVTGQW